MTTQNMTQVFKKKKQEPHGGAQDRKEDREGQKADKQRDTEHIRPFSFAWVG
eukprot:NODE_1554_length_942_cov_26.491601_g1083_i0.p6 GENE.NODE_1554_length_942_cov_26.491601_g1083_i0~~NODE_1554_length_942_cov_26.491601_g1083_i0.p6  ORF type:complete len:52 (-),score=4.67 NODE_1554_length_942_cov_26.491601_g1083_i0:161-316(-)